MRALVSSGRSDFVSSCPVTLDRPVSAAAAMFSIGALPVAGGAVERRRAHREDLDRVLRLHGGERVAGVDRTHERVGRLDGGHVAHLRDVELRGDARRHVLAEAGGRQRRRASSSPGSSESAVAAMFSAVGEARYGASATSTLATPASLRAPRRGTLRVVPGDQHVDVAAELGGGAHRVRGRGLERRVVVLGDDENGHGRRALRDDLGFVAQLGDELLHVRHLAAALALGGLDHLERDQARRDVDVERRPAWSWRAASSSPS